MHVLLSGVCGAVLWTNTTELTQRPCVGFWAFGTASPCLLGAAAPDRTSSRKASAFRCPCGALATCSSPQSVLRSTDEPAATSSLLASRAQPTSPSSNRSTDGYSLS